MKRIVLALIGIMALVGVGLSVPMLAASAGAESARADCDVPTITETETVMTDPGSDAVPAVPGVWANFQPNDNQAPFEGPPTFPSDPRGSWINHGEEVPGGHEGPDGVYNKGNPAIGGNWFFRQAAVAEIPAVPPTFEDVETEVPNPNFPCEEIPPPKDPKEPKEPKQPKAPKPPKTVTECEGSKCVKTETAPDGTTTTTVKEFPVTQQEEGF